MTSPLQRVGAGSLPLTNWLTSKDLATWGVLLKFLTDNKKVIPRKVIEI